MTRAAVAQFHSEVRKTDLICTQGFVNGKWIDAHADKHYSVIGTFACALDVDRYMCVHTWR